MSAGRERVLVVGAGPTGLSLALCLEAYGVPFDIIDVKDGPCRDSKALAVNPLSLDQLELFGHPDALGRSGRRISRLNVSYAGRRLNPVDLRWLDHERNYLLAQPQHVTERELLAALEGRGVRVAWGAELASVEARPGGAEALIAWPGRPPEARAYRYVVGCDGKRSRVREAVGATMEGTDYPMHLALGDFELDWGLDPREAHYCVFDETFFVIVPYAPPTWRLVVKYDGAPEASPPGPEAITEPVRRLLGRDPFRGPPSWFSKAPLYLKVATRLREGPIFLAGDAAHLFSPIGGTGMNTGMQDAFNLGWKLAFAARGWAGGEGLLESYAQERLPAVRANAAATDGLTRLIARVERSPERIEGFLPKLANRRLVSRQFPFAQSGLALQYPPSGALGVAEGPGARRIGAPCRGLPSLVRALGPGPRGGAPPAYVLVGSEADAGRLAAACECFAPPLRVVAVERAGEGTAGVGSARGAGEGVRRAGEGTAGVDGVRGAAGRGGAPGVVALGPDAFRRVGVEPGGVHVVRPDGIVSYVGDAGDVAAVVRHLASLFAERQSGHKAREEDQWERTPSPTP